MICIQLNGGLGNQMFQYACGRSLAFKRQTTLLLDTFQLINNKKKITNRTLELNIFNVGFREPVKRELELLKPLFYRIANVLALKLRKEGIQTSKYFIEKGYSFNSNIVDVGKDCFLVGYWQSYKYFQDIESIIRQDFQFKYGLDKKNKEIVNQMKENSISLHIRRNDFMNNINHGIHGTCSAEYYSNASEYIANRVKQPSFFVFSDDIEWARANLNLNYKCIYISGNIGKQSYIDMQMMSLCKHNIIANSSFSWWGAWLNPNTDKIVIAPKQWFSDEAMNSQTKDLIPETWIRL